MCGVARVVLREAVESRVGEEMRDRLCSKRDRGVHYPEPADYVAGRSNVTAIFYSVIFVDQGLERLASG